MAAPEHPAGPDRETPERKELRELGLQMQELYDAHKEGFEETGLHFRSSRRAPDGTSPEAVFWLRHEPHYQPHLVMALLYVKPGRDKNPKVVSWSARDEKDEKKWLESNNGVSTFDLRWMKAHTVRARGIDENLEVITPHDFYSHFRDYADSIKPAKK